MKLDERVLETLLAHAFGVPVRLSAGPPLLRRPVSGEIGPLYNARRDRWPEPFGWSDDFR